MNPRSSPQDNIDTARQVGTFRGLVIATPSQIQSNNQLQKIGECWLEQMLVQDGIYTPWRETNTTYLCFTLPQSASAELLACVKDSEPNRYSFVKETAHSTRYTFMLSTEELSNSVLHVTFESCENAGENPGGKQTVSFTWACPPPPNQSSLRGFIFWPLATLVYVLYMMPLFVVHALAPELNADKRLQSLQWKLYKIYRGAL